MTARHVPRTLLAIAVTAAVLHAQPAPPARDSLPGVSAHAMQLWRDAIVLDMHNDMPSKVADEGYDPDVRNPTGFGRGKGATDYPRLRASGITGVFLSAFVDAKYALMSPDSSFARAMLLATQVRAFAARHPDGLLFATTGADLRRAKREGKVAVFVGVEGGHAIQGSLARLRQLHDAGVRYMTLTWNNGNTWAGAAAGTNRTRTGGLTPFGRQVIREMNRIGILVDISHVSDATFWDAVRTSSRPVIASHSSARAINAHRRNLTDSMLVAVARTGGVVNVNFFSQFIDPAYSPRGPATPLKVLVDHIDHIAKVAGVDHVGIGSDFDGVTALPAGMEDVTMLPRLAQALLDRGYTDADIARILGGNMLRVLEAAIDPVSGR